MNMAVFMHVLFACMAQAHVWTIKKLMANVIPLMHASLDAGRKKSIDPAVAVSLPPTNAARASPFFFLQLVAQGFVSVYGCRQKVRNNVGANR